jgi:hypothetical protein
MMQRGDIDVMIAKLQADKNQWNEIKIIIVIGFIGMLIFGWLVFNYLTIVPKTILPFWFYVLIYYIIGTLLAISICLIIIGVIFYDKDD